MATTRLLFEYETKGTLENPELFLFVRTWYGSPTFTYSFPSVVLNPQSESRVCFV